MRVFVAGATGVIGRRLLPLLTSEGHEVIGLARSYGAAVEVELLGAVVAEADALDSSALSRVVKDAAPDAVVHLLTAIPARINPRRMGRDLAQTNRLRTEGTRNLLYAAEQAGVKRIISQGLACIYEPNTWVPATARSMADTDHSSVRYRTGRCRSSAPATAPSPSPTSATPARPSPLLCTARCAAH
jgi:nucleoside-diphosphate-sugar epimerase